MRVKLFVLTISMPFIFAKVCTDPAQIENGAWQWDSFSSPPYSGSGFRDNEKCTWSENGDWVWRPKNCTLLPFSKNAFCRSLRGRGLLIVGDSLVRQLFQSIFLLLGGNLAYLDETSCRANAFECRAQICEEEGFDIGSELHYLKCGKMNVSECRDWTRRLPHFGTIVLNSAAHSQPPENFEINVKNVAKIVEERRAEGSRVFWVTSTWGYLDFGKHFEPTTDPFPVTNNWNWDEMPRANARGAEIFREHNFHVIDTVPMTSRRPDKHYDSLHFCLPGPPDTWSQLLMNKMLLLDDIELPRRTTPLPPEFRTESTTWRTATELDLNSARSTCAPVRDAAGLREWKMKSPEFPTPLRFDLASDGASLAYLFFEETEISLLETDEVVVFFNETKIQSTPAKENVGAFIGSKTTKLKTTVAEFMALLKFPLLITLIVWNGEETVQVGDLCMRETHQRTFFDQKFTKTRWAMSDVNSVHPEISLEKALLHFGFSFTFGLPPIKILSDDVFKCELNGTVVREINGPTYSGNWVYEPTDISLLQNPYATSVLTCTLLDKSGNVLAWSTPFDLTTIFRADSAYSISVMRVPPDAALALSEQ